MRRGVVLGLAAGLVVLAACGGGASTVKADRDDGIKVIGGCKIKPKTSCPGANLVGAGLANAELNNSNLQRVDLAGSDLSSSDLRSTNLTSAVVTNVILRSADLSKSNLTSVNLTGSDLTDAYLRGATTNPAIFQSTIRCRTTKPDGSIDNTSCPVVTTTAPATTPTTKPKLKPKPKPSTPTTRPSPPTTRPTPPTTAPPTPPPCTLNTLQASYVAKFGLPPDGTTFALTACAGGYAGTNLNNPTIGPAFAVYQAQGSTWVALNVGSAGVCDGLNIPPAIAQQIGCV
jgi:Pentapeptide repeats (8 copies)